MDNLHTVIRYLRTYSAVLESCTPIVLDAVLERNPVPGLFLTITMDKSVHVSISLGTKIIDCIAWINDLERISTCVETSLNRMDERYSAVLRNYYCHHLSLSEALGSAGLSHTEDFYHALGLFALVCDQIDFVFDNYIISS